MLHISVMEAREKVGCRASKCRAVLATSACAVRLVVVLADAELVGVETLRRGAAG